MTPKIVDSFEMAAYIANLADDRKAHDIRVLKTEEVSTLADFFVIVSVDSRTQMTSLSEMIIKSMKDKWSQLPLGQEADKAGGWTLVDYGQVILHVFREDQRQYYQLERFWSHASEVPQSEWLSETSERQAS